LPNACDLENLIKIDISATFIPTQMKKLLVLAVFALYASGAWKMWNGFEKTHFNQNFVNRFTMSVLWPLFFAVNKSYRQNFQRVLKGN